MPDGTKAQWWPSFWELAFCSGRQTSTCNNQIGDILEEYVKYWESPAAREVSLCGQSGEHTQSEAHLNWVGLDEQEDCQNDKMGKAFSAERKDRAKDKAWEVREHTYSGGWCGKGGESKTVPAGGDRESKTGTVDTNFQVQHDHSWDTPSSHCLLIPAHSPTKPSQNSSPGSFLWPSSSPACFHRTPYVSLSHHLRKIPTKLRTTEGRALSSLPVTTSSVPGALCNNKHV